MLGFGWPCSMAAAWGSRVVGASFWGAATRYDGGGDPGLDWPAVGWLKGKVVGAFRGAWVSMAAAIPGP